MPKLVILDGNSLLYRGFFAMRALSTSDRLPTNAVYSFVLMLLTILEREKPDAIFVAFDPPVATFRHQELASYKGTRQKMPDDLKPQRALAREAAAAFRVPNVEVNGYEADDVCGTLAEIGKHKGYDVLIVTGDGDALQLVDDGSPLEGRGQVQTMITVKGVTDTVTYDEAAVQARYGLSPSQITDFKGIKGDTSDNLPGIPGIGEKGASKLLKEYGTLENLLFHVDELPEKTKNLLIEHTDSAVLCKRLATIVRDVPLPEWVEITPDYQAIGPDYEAIKALFDRLEFRTLLKRLPNLEREQRAKTIEENNPPAPNNGGVRGDSTSPDPAPSLLGAGGERQTISTQAQMDALLERLSDTDAPAGLQLHLTPPEGVKAAAMTLMNAELQGVAFGLPGNAYYASWAESGAALTPYLENAARSKSVYDLKLVTGVLARVGVTLRGGAFDALLAAYLLNAGRAGYPLTDLAADNAGIELVADPADPAAYAMDEASAIQALEAVLAPRLQRDGLENILNDIELPLAAVLSVMERKGVSVDADWMRKVSKMLGEQVASLETEIFALAGEKFSVGSTKQLQEVLFDKLKLPAGKKTKTGYSTGADVLEDLASKGHDIARKIVQWREVSKLKSTYADALPALINPVTGKVHTSLNQTVASTGRLSSSNPNLQNIPVRTEIGREIRKGFVASPGYVLVSADYSQIELRLFAHITKDPGLVQAFQTDADIHAQTARRIFEVPEDEAVTSDQRRQAKTINFAVIYGASPFRVSSELGIDFARAAELIKAYLDLYPSVRAYLETILEGAREKGYVQTLLGRRRYVPDINSRVFQFRQSAEREAANMPVQGTSADIIKLAMLHVASALADSNLGAHMVLQVHDELLFECPTAEVRQLSKLVKDAMQNAYPLDVPLKAEVKSGHNWWDVTPVGDDDGEVLEGLVKQD
ncbi:MAG: DNA polymerase I [Janthinobacterium lividum]